MTVGIITDPIAKAMATQVKRVNNDPKTLLQKITTLEGTIATQKDVIVNLRREIEQLRGGTIQIESSAPNPDYMTASAYARKHHVAHSTITRKYHKGHLKGYTDDRGHVFIKADQIYVKGQCAKKS